MNNSVLENFFGYVNRQNFLSWSRNLIKFPIWLPNLADTSRCHSKYSYYNSLNSKSLMFSINHMYSYSFNKAFKYTRTFNVFFNGHDCTKSLNIFQWDGYIRLIDRKYFLLVKHSRRFVFDFSRTCEIRPGEKSVTTKKLFNMLTLNLKAMKLYHFIWKPAMTW